MQIFSIKSLQNDHSPRSIRFHPRDAKIVQHSKVSKPNLPYKQTERQDPHDHQLDAEKPFTKSNALLQ